jgi:hypothetical protein
MAISKMFEKVTRYITEAAVEIFSPNHDSYPLTGVQPFTGIPHNKRHNHHW